MGFGTQQEPLRLLGQFSKRGPFIGPHNFRRTLKGILNFRTDNMKAYEVGGWSRVYGLSPILNPKLYGTPPATGQQALLQAWRNRV